MKRNYKPIIGITLDYSTKETYAKTPWYAIRQNYIHSLTRNGANVMLLHYEFDDLPALSQILDGIIFTGGDFDIPPQSYGQTIEHESVNPNPFRTDFELKIFEFAFKERMPILGICGGHQLINVALGGTLIQHIPATVANALQHQQLEAKHLPTHDVEVMSGSELDKIVQSQTIKVNTSHHQSIDKLGTGLIASGIATDNVIESIELTDPEHFVMGLQWHPEYYHTDADQKIIKNFVAQCQKFKQKNQ